LLPAAPHRDPPSFPTRRSSDLRKNAASKPSTLGRKPPRRNGAASGPSSPTAATRSSSHRPGGTSPIAPRPSHSSRQYAAGSGARSEEHTSELQSRENLVCRLLL